LGNADLRRKSRGEEASALESNSFGQLLGAHALLCRGLELASAGCLGVCGGQHRETEHGAHHENYNDDHHAHADSSLLTCVTNAWRKAEVPQGEPTEKESIFNVADWHQRAKGRGLAIHGADGWD